MFMDGKGIWGIMTGFGSQGGANQGQKWIFRTSETVHGSLYDSSEESIWHIRSGIFLLQRGLWIVRKRYMAHWQWYIAHFERFMGHQDAVYGTLVVVYSSRKVHGVIYVVYIVRRQVHGTSRGVYGMPWGVLVHDLLRRVSCYIRGCHNCDINTCNTLILVFAVLSPAIILLFW